MSKMSREKISAIPVITMFVISMINFGICFGFLGPFLGPRREGDSGVSGLRRARVKTQEGWGEEGLWEGGVWVLLKTSRGATEARALQARPEVRERGG